MLYIKDDFKYTELEQITATLQRENQEMAEALEKIKNWELPETGSFWSTGSPISYEAENGSNGVREYIQKIAREALAKRSKV